MQNVNVILQHETYYFIHTRKNIQWRWKAACSKQIVSSTGVPSDCCNVPVALATSSRVGSSNGSSSAGGSSLTGGGGAAKQSSEGFVVHKYDSKCIFMRKTFSSELNLSLSGYTSSGHRKRCGWGLNNEQIYFRELKNSDSC